MDPVVHTSNIVDPNESDSAAGCLELIEECNERSPSKERSKTPIPPAQSQNREESILDASMDTSKTTERGSDGRDEKLSRNEADEYLEGFHETSEINQPSDTERNLATTSENRPKGVSRLETVKSETIADLGSDDSVSLEATQREFKKLKEKALSLDSELFSPGEAREVPAKTFERRRSKIFETAEKFNQMASNVETEKPKKIFIPGVNVGGAKRVFERKASLSTIGVPPPAKHSASKIIIDVPTDKKAEKSIEQPKLPRETRSDEPLRQQQQQQPQQQEQEEEKKRDEAKKRAVDIITGAIGKPPMQRRVNGSPPASPSGAGQEPRKLPLKIPVGANDMRTATVSVSTPVDTNFAFEAKSSDADKRASVTIVVDLRFLVILVDLRQATGS